MTGLDPSHGEAYTGRRMEQEESPPEGHTVQLDQFEGPLDLLIFLIRKNEVNIYDIPISRITEQYLQYLEYAAHVDLEKITDFYVMAATLLYIKSRMLLPESELDEEEEGGDPRQELVNKLIEYQKYRKLSDLMGEKEDESEFTLERRSQTVLPFDEEEQLWEQLDVWDLLKTFSRLVSNLNIDRVINLHEEVTVNEKLTLIDELLQNRGEFSFSDLLRRNDSAMELVCAFIAILESARQRTIRIMQNRMFGDIRITAGPGLPDQSRGGTENELLEV